MPECQSLLDAGLAGIGGTLRSAARLSLFLEFDGSLTPIIDNPGDVRLEPSTWELLRRLANRRDVLIVIVSGRGAADLQARVGIEDIVYAGNHGLEISGKGLHFSEPFAAARRELLLRISESLG